MFSLVYMLRESSQGRLAAVTGVSVFGALTLLGLGCFPTLREWLAGLKKSLHLRLHIEVIKMVYGHPQEEGQARVGGGGGG